MQSILIRSCSTASWRLNSTIKMALRSSYRANYCTSNESRLGGTAMSDAVPARKELPKLIVVMASDLDDDGQLDTVLNPHAPRPVLSPSSTLPRFCILERTLSNAHKCS